MKQYRPTCCYPSLNLFKLAFRRLKSPKVILQTALSGRTHFDLRYIARHFKVEFNTVYTILTAYHRHIRWPYCWDLVNRLYGCCYEGRYHWTLRFPRNKHIFKIFHFITLKPFGEKWKLNFRKLSTNLWYLQGHC